MSMAVVLQIESSLRELITVELWTSMESLSGLRAWYIYAKI